MTVARFIVPYLASAYSMPDTLPGTPTARWPSVLAPLTTLPSLSRYMLAVAATGACDAACASAAVSSAAARAIGRDFKVLANLMSRAPSSCRRGRAGRDGDEPILGRSPAPRPHLGRTDRAGERHRLGMQSDTA